jgi:hypothetical protein
MTIKQFTKELIAEGAHLMRGTYTIRLSEQDTTIAIVTIILREYPRINRWTASVTAKVNSIYGKAELSFMQIVEGEYSIIGPGSAANIVDTVYDFWATIGGSAKTGIMKQGYIKDFFQYRIPSKQRGISAYGEGNYFVGQFAWLLNYIPKAQSKTIFAQHKFNGCPVTIIFNGHPLPIDTFHNLKGFVCSFLEKNFA